MSHQNAEYKRQLSSCFGTAGAILDSIERGEYEVAQVRGHEGPVWRLKNISFPAEERGERRMEGASPFALHVLNQELKRHDSRVSSGWETVDGQVRFWIEPFEKEHVNFRIAHGRINTEFKALLKSTQDPLLDRPAHDGCAPNPGKRWWLGPFSPDQAHFVDGVMSALLTFHGIEGIQSRTWSMNDGRGTTYVECDPTEMAQLLAPEGISARGRS